MRHRPNLLPVAISPGLLAVLALFLGHLGWLLSGWGPRAWQPWLGNLWVVVVVLAATLHVARGLRRRPVGERRAWRWLVAALLAYVWGAGTWAALELLTDTPPFPSVADLGYVAVMPLFAAAILALPRPRLGGVAGWTLALDLLVFCAVAGGWLWVGLVSPAWSSHETPLARTLSSLYPLLDLLLLTLVLEMLLHGARLPALRWLGAAVACYACGDLIFALLSAGGGYQTGDLVDLCWPLAAVLCAVAVGSPTGARAAWLLRAGPALAFALPYVAAAGASGLLAWCLGHAPGFTGLALGVMLLTTLLVAARQTLAWREAQALRAEVQAINAGLEQEVRERTQDIRATFEGGLLALGTALEARDFETAGHTARVVRWAHALGGALGLPAAELDSLAEGAYLHDLGKLAVPDHILLKPGRLTPDEWTTMQSHAVRGHALAARLPHLSPGALEVIRHHHEKWDGSGYPDALAGEAIPRLARLFAVCDVYDALTSARPYKAAWTPAAARAELWAQAGRHFDPQVVSAFLALDLGTAAGGPLLAARPGADGGPTAAHPDRATGLPGPAALDADLRARLAHASPGVALVLVEVGGVGDAALRGVAGALLGAVGGAGVYRVGGVTFAALLNLTAPGELPGRLARVGCAVSHVLADVPGGALALGAALAGPGQATPEALWARAEADLAPAPALPQPRAG